MQAESFDNLHDMDPLSSARFNMVENQIKPGGVRDARLCRVFAQIPREMFMPASLRDVAYADNMLDVIVDEERRTMLTPLALARLIELAQVRADDLVLDIAGASGYSSAILAGLASTVISLEAHVGFAMRANDIWKDIGIDNAVAVTGVLSEGQLRQAPFDVIIINGALDEVPPSLLAQLSNGGRLVAGLRTDARRNSKAVIYTRHKNRFSRHVAFDMVAPLLVEFASSPQFEF